jgi:hypothetical protein
VLSEAKFNLCKSFFDSGVGLNSLVDPREMGDRLFGHIQISERVTNSITSPNHHTTTTIST